MKITRRNFIASVIGGVVGIQVTPLPWKITDDAAIWTQNWPWVPVPATGAVTEGKHRLQPLPGWVWHPGEKGGGTGCKD